MGPRLCPSLGYRNASAAIDFLVTAFGFEKVVVYADESGVAIGHAELRWPEGGRISVHSVESDRNSIIGLMEAAAAGVGYPAFSIHIDTGDPDALYTRAVAAGARIIREIQDSPYGTRGFVACDPEGLHWSFGTPLPALVRDAEGKWVPGR